MPKVIWSGDPREDEMEEREEWVFYAVCRNCCTCRPAAPRAMPEPDLIEMTCYVCGGIDHAATECRVCGACWCPRECDGCRFCEASTRAAARETGA